MYEDFNGNAGNKNPLSISVEKLNVGIQMYEGVSNKVIYNPGLVKIIYDELNTVTSLEISLCNNVMFYNNSLTFLV